MSLEYVVDGYLGNFHLALFDPYSGIRLLIELVKPSPRVYCQILLLKVPLNVELVLLSLDLFEQNLLVAILLDLPLQIRIDLLLFQ